MMSNAKDREMAMIVWVVAVGFLVWLASLGLGLDSCVPERDEMDHPTAGHVAAWLRTTP